jgi:hypothetical protein
VLRLVKQLKQCLPFIVFQPLAQGSGFNRSEEVPFRDIFGGYCKDLSRIVHEGVLSTAKAYEASNIYVFDLRKPSFQNSPLAMMSSTYAAPALSPKAKLVGNIALVEMP